MHPFSERPPLRRIGLWLALAAFAGLSLLLVFGSDEAIPGRSFRALWNLGHVAYFALISLLLLQLPGLKRAGRGRRWGLLLAVTLLLGGLIEYLQLGTARTADWMDLLRNFGGTLLVLAFWPGVRPRRPLLRGLCGLLALAWLAWAAWPLATALQDERAARRQFPVLADFTAPFELDRWGGDAGRRIVADPALASGPLLQLALQPRDYSGAGLKWLPADWRGYRRLRIRLYLPGEEPLGLTLRIHDRAHERGPRAYAFSDRFNRSFRLRPGWNELLIPLGDIRAAPARRAMDLSQIADLSLFAAGLKQPRLLYLQRIELLQ